MVNKESYLRYLGKPPHSHHMYAEFSVENLKSSLSPDDLSLLRRIEELLKDPKDSRVQANKPRKHRDLLAIVILGKYI